MRAVRVNSSAATANGAALLTAFELSWDPDSDDYQGEWRFVPTRANLQPALANYTKRPGDTAFRAFALDVIQVENGVITAITGFSEDRFASFGLPELL